MQISKLFLAACVPALCLAPISFRAADSQTQPTPPPAASTNAAPTKAQLEKQAKADAKAHKEAEKAKKAEAKKQAEAKQKAAKADSTKAAPAPNAGKATPAVLSIQAPPLPISADKEARLTELLRKYKADEIAPEQYHSERAKILAEP